MVGGEVGRIRPVSDVYTRMTNRCFVKSVLQNGGQIIPLLLDPRDSDGLGLCNPSIFIDDGAPWCILRNVNYTIYHCENNQTFNNRWGPLSYLNPEHDRHLRTTNFLLKLNPDLSVAQYWKIDTSKLDKEPMWEFVGLEDARLVRWDGILYGIGVRRDTTTNGQGRMEFSELQTTSHSVKEVSRHRIEHPVDPNWYCEKNWMPVIDVPYHFVKYTNPVEVVQCDLPTLKSRRSREVDESSTVPNLPFLRGGSQVIPWNNFRICVVHEVDLTKNYLDQKDAAYRHRFVTWDRNWNLVKITEPFSFLGGEIEFCCGLALWQNDLLVSFGFQDNCAFILRIPEAMIRSVLMLDDTKWRLTDCPTLEITTSMPPRGCPMHCTYCPQDTIAAAYDGVPTLSYANFVQLLAKVPREVQVTFAGFSEPFLNPASAAMICHAHETGHRVSVFTTGIGMHPADVEAIRHIPFAGVQGGFVLHLPDQEGYLAHGNADLFPAIKKAGLSNFETITMGTLPTDLRELFPGTIRRTMYSRAGNVDRADVVTAEPKQSATCGCRERLYHNVLLPNGDIVLCCMDYGLKHVLGNLYRDDYAAIVPTDGTAFELCRRCENGV